MHAMVAVHTFDPARFEEQLRELHERIVPMIRHQPGFVSGYWTCDREANRYHGFIVFDSESSARKLATFVREVAQPSTHAVDLESLSVVEILAEASAP
jgi:hypothetical protein